MTIFPEKGLQAGTVLVRAGGIPVGIVAHKTPVSMVQCHKVGAQPAAFAPMVKQDANITFFGTQFSL